MHGWSMMPDAGALLLRFSDAFGTLSGPWSLSCVQTRSHDPFNSASKQAGPRRSLAGPQTHPEEQVGHQSTILNGSRIEVSGRVWASSYQHSSAR